MADVRQLASTIVVSAPDLRAGTIDGTDTIWSDLDARYGDFKGHLLISSFTFDLAWPTREMRPFDDETVRLSRSGEFVIVPRGGWHTARPRRRTTMLFVTPGEGADNREQPVREAA